MIAKSGANSRTEIVLSPLFDAVSALQMNLQTASQNGRAVSVSQIQQETNEVTAIAYQLGLPQCTIVGS